MVSRPDVGMDEVIEDELVKARYATQSEDPHVSDGDKRKKTSQVGEAATAYEDWERQRRPDSLIEVLVAASPHRRSPLPSQSQHQRQCKKRGDKMSSVSHLPPHILK